MASHHRCIAGEVDRLGGIVARYIGDGVLAYFGYPQTREDDAERAVLAAFNIVRAVDGLETIIGPPGTLRTRIGIASGLVIVSDPVGMGPSKDIAFGYTPNFAARLQSIAEAGTVVICDTTKSQIGSLFECQQIDAVNLKGIPSPQRAWWYPPRTLRTIDLRRYVRFVPRSSAAEVRSSSCNINGWRLPLDTARLC